MIPNKIKYKGETYKHIIKKFPSGFGIEYIIKIYKKTDNLIINRWEKVYTYEHINTGCDYTICNNSISKIICDFYGFDDIVSLLKK